MDTSINPFVVGSGIVEAQSAGVTASSKSSTQKSSFLSQLTNILGKTLGAGVGIAASAALPGIGKVVVGAASDKLVQSLVKNLSSTTSGSETSSIQVAKQNVFRAPEMLAGQNLGFLQSASNPYIAAQNQFTPVNPSSVSLRI